MKHERVTRLGVCAAVNEECPPSYETAGEVMIASPIPNLCCGSFIAVYADK